MVLRVPGTWQYDDACANAWLRAARRPGSAMERREAKHCSPQAQACVHVDLLVNWVPAGCRLPTQDQCLQQSCRAVKCALNICSPRALALRFTRGQTRGFSSMQCSSKSDDTSGPSVASRGRTPLNYDKPDLPHP
jgi:hypothetical protein